MNYLFLVSMSCLCAQAAQQEASLVANPIRKVVTMLQMMQNKIVAEGEKEKALFDKFVCFCENSGGDLAKSIGEANVKIPELTSAIEEAEGQKVQLDNDLKNHKADREDAKDSMKQATALREKEAAAFAKVKGDSNTNIDALTSAIAAISKGMAGGFLQTDAAQVLRKLTLATPSMNEGDRQDVLSFLSAGGNSEYAPRAGEINGILKTMKDEMLGSLAAATQAENAAIASYKGLMAAKGKEVAALTKAIEDKLIRGGELAKSIAEMKNDLEDTQAALAEDEKFAANLKGDCDTKKKDWEVAVKTRSEELLAIADTIKILNDDDALELFKKTLPTPASSFVQLKETTTSVQANALAIIREAQGASKPVRDQLGFIALALHGKKIGFEKVIAMIDQLVSTLHEEQKGDDEKKEYCNVQFDSTDDQKKALERSISDSEAAIANAQETISTLVAEIKALTDAIKALDKSVAEATEQRKQEHSAFKELMAQDTAAKELLNFAKNRLQAFYNPKLHKDAPKAELSAEGRIFENQGGIIPTEAPGGIANTGITVLAQISTHARSDVEDAPPAAPTAPGAAKPLHQENQGVIQMIDLLIKDLDKDMTVAETNEKDAQAEYATMMKNAAEKRAADSKSLNQKVSAKADMEVELQSHTDAKEEDSRKLGATNQVIHNLHGECDWLLQHFDTRKAARVGEVDALGKAKAVLSGADYSLLQTGARSMLRQR